MESIVDGDVRRIQARVQAIGFRFEEIAEEEEALKAERKRLDEELNELRGSSKEMKTQIETVLKGHK